MALSSISATATGVHVPRVSYSCPQPPQETLQYQQVGVAQAPMKSLLLPWVLVHVRPCVCLPIVESLLPPVQWSSCPAGLSSQMLWASSS